MKYPDGLSPIEKEAYDVLMYIYDNCILPDKRADFRHALLTLRRKLYKVDMKNWKKGTGDLFVKMMKDF